MPKASSHRKRRTQRGKKDKFTLTVSTLQKMKPNDRYKAIKYANDGFIRNLCSKLGKLKYKKLTRQQEKIVKKYRSKLKLLCNRHCSIKMKRRILSQKGGSLALLKYLFPTYAAQDLGLGLVKSVNAVNKFFRD